MSTATLGSALVRSFGPGRRGRSTADYRNLASFSPTALSVGSGAISLSLCERCFSPRCSGGRACAAGSACRVYKKRSQGLLAGRTGRGQASRGASRTFGFAVLGSCGLLAEGVRGARLSRLTSSSRISSADCFICASTAAAYFR